MTIRQLFLIRFWLVLASAMGVGLGPAMGREGPMNDWQAGAAVTVTGAISQIPHQHMIQMLSDHRAEYIDLDDGGQIVAYLRGPFACSGRVRLRGKVLDTRGRSKRPGDPRTVSELQLQVTHWECLLSIEELIGQLGDGARSMEQKQAVKRQLVEAGKTAIPALLEHLADPRVYEAHRDIQNYYGMPPTGPRPSPIYADIPVGSACREILYDIVTPRYRSPYERVIKPYSRSMFVVHDWHAWWARHKHQSLRQIHAELQPLVDKYWQEHGTAQELP